MHDILLLIVLGLFQLERLFSFLKLVLLIGFDDVCERFIILDCLNLLRDTNEISWCCLKNKWVHMRKDCIILAENWRILV